MARVHTIPIRGGPLASDGMSGGRAPERAGAPVRLRAAAMETGMVLAVFGLAVLIGPFGTFGLTVAERAQYWGIIILVNWAQLRFLQILLFRLAGQDRFWLATLGSTLTASFPATLEVLWLERIFRPENAADLSYPELYPQVLALTLAIMAPVSWFFFSRAMAAELDEIEANAPKMPAAAESAFHRRIPLALGRELHALQAEDHYVRVYTAKGDDLVLHRFSDAVNELAGHDGLRVHRSWWVAREGVAGVERRDRKVWLKLKNGQEAPVSRTYLGGVRNAGWLS